MMTALLIVGIVIGGLVLLVVLFLIWRYIAFVRNSRRHQREQLERLLPVTDPIKAGQEPPEEEVERLAADPASRNTLWEALLYLQRLDLFPE